MANKITARFTNNTDKTIRIVIFEVTENENGEKIRTVVFAGAVPSYAYASVELDNTIRPWASIATKNYTIGEIINADSTEREIELRDFADGVYNLEYWR
ncbi:hypothetical protein [Mucilaginibacter sp. OK098]|uniref:hypothetical protein n=1 Tax=Mucilaginibacter sp. OK098 TaxID=1855297 RepID=UPI00091DD3C8|nr:hypothetical protein [Mucilaginibacter sp. OK098]SHM89792.1 hypothetical protein SAMN05216524_10417 [Mucilaginibacter sp. OK098]